MSCNLLSEKNVRIGFVIFVLVMPLFAARLISARTIAYISNADSREIYVLELNERNGNLQLIEKVAVNGNVMPLAVSPDRKYLYAGLRSEPYSVMSFAIEPKSSKLQLINIAPLADNMAYISTDRTGNYLFGASYSGNKISVNKVEPDGAVVAVPLAVIPTGKNAHCILTDLSNNFLFVSNLGDDAIRQYRFDSTAGTINPLHPPSVETKKGAGPRHFVFHPNRRFVYGINELDGTVNVYSLNASGVLSLLESVSIMPANSSEKPWAADLRLTPDGKYLYASERTTNSLVVFRVDSKSGKLLFVERVLTEAQPRGFNISPSGKYLLAVGQKSNSLSVYRIKKLTGKLKKITQMKVGENPNWIEIIELPFQKVTDR
jgi:6-phosphogluconolactonase